MIYAVLHLIGPGLRRAFRAMRFGWRVNAWLWLLLTNASHAAESAPRLYLEIDIAIERGAMTGVLFDFGDGIWGENSSVASVAPGTTPKTVRLALPDRPVRGLRFDPTSDDQPVLITAMRITDDQGRVLAPIDLRSLRPMNQIESILPEAGGVRVRPIPKADDPMLRFDLGPLQRKMYEVLRWRTVGNGMIASLAVCLIVLMCGAIVIAGRASGATAPPLAGLGIFGFVFGARLLWLNLFSRTVPFWDEWEGDALYILIPFSGGFLDWNALVMPQWEHRILLTRIITLFGTLLNGEWDPRVAMTVSAGMFAATIAVLGMILIATRQRAGLAAAAILAVAAALPYDINNLLWGGQTQMYGLILMAVCSIAIAATGRVTAMTCAGAGAAGLVSLFTMGAGPVGPGCAVGICLVRAWFEREQRRRLFSLAAVFLCVALIGVFLHVSSRAHVPLYATSFAQFKKAFVGVLAWPLPPHVGWAMLAWLPWVINGVAILRRREATTVDWLAVGLGGWAMVDALALGYARQYEGPPFDSRFFTPISVGAWASLASCVALLGRYRTRRAAALPAATMIAVCVGLMVYGVRGLEGARSTRIDREDRERRVRTFLSTGNTIPVLEKPPHASGEPVIDRLESPLLQRILPAAFRRELARFGRLAAAPAEAGPVTITVRSLMKMGPLIALLGIAALATHVVRTRRDMPPKATLPVRRKREPHSSGDRTDRICYVVAAAITVGWFFAYNAVRRDGLVDEPGHLADIHHFLGAQAGWPESMPMLPGYHFAALSVFKLWPVASTLTTARAVSTVLTLLGLACFAIAWKRLHGTGAGRATLLLALLPLAQPFTAMAYTDWPALALLLAAWWAQVTGRRALAVVALAAGVAIRQTNLVWAGFFVAWEFFRSDEPRATLVSRLRWLMVFAVVSGIAIASAGRLTLGSQHGNDFRFNVASVHFAGALLLLLGLPVWVAHAGPTLLRWREAVRARPRTALGFGVVALVAVTVIATTFANPHIWNRELFWDGCTFTLLRNWPLVGIDTHPWLRIASGINVVAMAAAVIAVIQTQRWRRELWLVVAFGIVPVATNSLVEPRYFIPLAGMVLCFLEVDAANWRRLAVWWGVLSAAHAPFVARALSLW